MALKSSILFQLPPKKKPNDILRGLGLHIAGNQSFFTLKQWRSSDDLVLIFLFRGFVLLNDLYNGFPM